MHLQSDAAESLLGSYAIIPTLGKADRLNWFEGIPGERAVIHVHARDVGGRFSIMETVVAPGSAAPLHTHVEDELFFVVEGNVRFRLDADIFDVPAGRLVAIPANTPHAWINRTDKPLRMVATFIPGGVEKMFTRLAGLAPDKMAEVAAQYGTIVLGPPMRP